MRVYWYCVLYKNIYGTAVVTVVGVSFGGLDGARQAFPPPCRRFEVKSCDVRFRKKQVARLRHLFKELQVARAEVLKNGD